MGRTRKLHLKGRGEPTKKNIKEFKSTRVPGEKAIIKGKENKEAQRQARRSGIIQTVEVLPEVSGSERIDTCTDATQQNMMKYHLRADMIHDHGANFLAFGNTLFSGADTTLSVNEDTVSDYFRRFFPAVNNTIRLKNAIRFSIANKTELFPADGPAAFKPFIDVPNEKVGIVQDAGFVLFKAMGSKNIVTFGSVLDQAGKPVQKTDNPLAYIVPDIPFTFPACVYGFDPRAVSNVTINGFNGQSCECIFNYTFQERQYTGGTGDRPLQINKFGGDFKSIAQIAELGAEKDKFAGYIGKALGDITLVASLQQQIGENVNSYYPGSQTLKYIKDPAAAAVAPIQKFILNTGDRLNHIRAYAFGVDSVYSSSVSTGFRNFEYIPGIITGSSPTEQYDMFMTRLKILLESVDKTYEDLLVHISDLSEEFVYTDSYKSGLELITTPAQVVRIKILLTNLISIIETFRVYVLHHFIGIFSKYTGADSRPDKLNELIKDYEYMLQIVDKVRPSAVSTKNKGGRDILNIIPLFRMLPNEIFDASIYTEDAAAGAGGSILKTQLDELMREIRPRRIFDIVGSPIRKTDILKGSHTIYVSNIYQLVGKNASISAPFSNIFNLFTFGGSSKIEGLTVGGTVGGQLQTVKIFAQPFMTANKVLSQIKEPVINKKCNDILDEYPLTFSIAFNAYQTYKLYPPSILDPVLLQHVLNAYYNAGGVNGESDLLYNFDARLSVVHTVESLTFNEWSCRYNAKLAKYDDNNNELSDVLMYYSEEFRKLYTLPTPPGSPLASAEGASPRNISRAPSFLYKKLDIDIDRSRVMHRLVLGGQRVSLENLNIDETKSFVKSVGDSPSVVDK